MPRAARNHDVCQRALDGAGSGARVVFGLLAVGLLCTAAGPGVRAPAAPVLSASWLEAQATPLDLLVGVVEQHPSATLEGPRPAGPPAAARGRPEARSWAATPPPSQADAVIRRLGAVVLRQDNGRMADRPSLCICSAQGPPV